MGHALILVPNTSQGDITKYITKIQHNNHASVFAEPSDLPTYTSQCMGNLSTYIIKKTTTFERSLSLQLISQVTKLGDGYANIYGKKKTSGINTRWAISKSVNVIFSGKSWHNRMIQHIYIHTINYTLMPTQQPPHNTCQGTQMTKRTCCNNLWAHCVSWPTNISDWFKIIWVWLSINLTGHDR